MQAPSILLWYEDFISIKNVCLKSQLPLLPHVWQFSTTVDLTVVDLKRDSQYDSHVQVWSLETFLAGLIQNSALLLSLSLEFNGAGFPSF